MDKVYEVLQEICKRIVPGKKVVQKLIYLIERKDVQLGLDYSIHFYGPYSSDLNQTLHDLESQNLIQIDTSKQTHYIKAIGDCDVKGYLSEEESEIVDEVLATFSKKSPGQLELLTTADFVYQDLVNRGVTPSDQKLIDGVKKIKGGKFTEKSIESSIRCLKETGYIV